LTRKRALRALRGESGFTMIELIVAMPIMLVVMGGLVLMLTTVTHWSSQTQEETTLQMETRAAVNRLESEIRGAFIGNGTPEITSATATSITFTTPDEWGTTISGTAPNQTEQAFHLLKVSYQLSNGTLQRQFATSTNTFPNAPTLQAWSFGATGPWSTVIGQTGLGTITNSSIFTYYNLQGMQSIPWTAMSFPITSTVGIKAVGINLTLSSGGPQPVKYNVNEIVSLRQTDN